MPLETTSCLSYRECLTALRGDAVIAPQLETHVAVGEALVRVDGFSDLPDRLVVEVAASTHAWEFRDDAFADAYNRYESALFAVTFRLVVIAPIVGLARDNLPIRLSDDTTLDVMTDEEAVLCVAAGLFRLSVQCRSL